MPMKNLLYLTIITSILISGAGLSGCRSNIHERTIFQGDWAVTKVRKPRKHKVRVTKKPVNSRLFNQPGPLKF